MLAFISYVRYRMREWTIRCFLSSGSRDVIDEWLDALSPKERAKFLDTITGLRDQPLDAWSRPKAAQLHGPCVGLVEIIVKGPVQHRAIGFFGPGRGDFTLLSGAVEKGGKFQPPNTCTTAQGRRGIVEQDHARAHECDF